MPRMQPSQPVGKDRLNSRLITRHTYFSQDIFAFLQIYKTCRQLAKHSLFMCYLGDWTAGLRLHDQDGICIVLCASEDRHLVQITSSLTAGLWSTGASLRSQIWQALNIFWAITPCSCFHDSGSTAKASRQHPQAHMRWRLKYIISKPGVPRTSSHIWYPWNVVCCLDPKQKTQFLVHTAHCHSEMILHVSLYRKIWWCRAACSVHKHYDVRVKEERQVT